LIKTDMGLFIMYDLFCDFSFDYDIKKKATD